MDEEDELYKIENYSDNDLFRMLDLTNPTDRELEAKILMEIDKYDNIDESSAKKLKVFFDNVYKYFFEDGDSESLYEEEDVIQEGFDTALEKEPTPTSLVPADRVITTTLEYDKSDLNPLLTETHTRQIQLDSAFRDFENYKTSTDYLINLSEVLHNVVSLKLHSVNIPYTWYNVNGNNNSNYFHIKGVNGGVKDVYDFKIEVAPGSYNIDELVTALNESIGTLVLDYPEVNFGTTTVVNPGKSTNLVLQLDIQNVFTEIQYYLFFESSANTFDVDVRQTTIPSFLGFSTLVIPESIAIPTPSGVSGKPVVSVDDTYTINSIYSNFSDMYNATGSSTGTPNPLNPLDEFLVIVEVKDSSGTVTKPGNNYITFINYEGPGNYVAGTLPLNEVTIYLEGISEDISLTRGTIMESVNRALSTSSSFTGNSMLQAYDISYDKRDVHGGSLTTETMQRFQLIFSFEPAVITYTSNMKQIVIFPDESTFSYPLWTGQSSVFMFDENIVFNQPNSIQGDIYPVSTIYNIYTNPVMKVECTKLHYNNVHNNYSITLDNASYTMNEYVGIINYTEQYKNSEINSKFSIKYPNTTKQYIKSDIFYDIGANKVRMSFDMSTSFDQTDYELDLTNCFLGKAPFSIGSILSITDPTLNEFTVSTLNTIFPFTLNTTNNKILVTPKAGQGNSTVPAYTILIPEGTYTPLKLVAAVNNTFCTIQGDNDGASPPVSLNGLNMTQTKLTYTASASYYSWKFTYTIVNKMSAQNYKVILEDDKREFVADTTNLFTFVSHNLKNTDAIRFSSLGTTVGTYSIIFAANTTYYVTNSTTNTFKISLVSGGNPIDITNAGTCTGVNQGTESNFAASTDDKFTLTSHGFADGDTIEFSSLGTTVGTYSATFAINTTYYVTNSTANTFKISHVSNGAEIDITTAGTCTSSYPDNDGGTGSSWKSYLGFTDTVYSLLSSSENNYTSQITSNEYVYVDPNKTITIVDSNNSFLFSPYSTIKGLYAQDNSSEINIVVPNGTYGVYQLYNELNNILNLTPETNGSIIYSNFDLGGNESTVLQININKLFSAEDYELIFFDENETDLQCNLAKNTPGIRGTTTWDVSIGWLMGFRTYPKYQLSPTNALNSLYVAANKYTYNSSTNIITLTTDSIDDMRIYKNLYLIIDDFTQNHVNDGLITGIRKNPNADPPVYSSRATRTCNPITDRNQSSIFNANQPGMGLTEKQLFAANMITEENMATQARKVYSDPPYVKDMFGLIPLKLGSLTHGSIITESGGVLQDSTRKYFGPVNITKMNIKLLNDHGDVLDLNNANWSFSITCEYLYNFKGI